DYIDGDHRPGSAAFSHTRSRTNRPTARPMRSPASWSRRVCTPANIRLFPASLAAAAKLLNDRVTPGSTSEVTVMDRWGPKVCPSMTVAAAEITLCAPGYDGSDGVLSSGV